jgi:DNA-binding GntR family transcriptional regulator
VILARKSVDRLSATLLDQIAVLPPGAHPVLTEAGVAQQYSVTRDVADDAIGRLLITGAIELNAFGGYSIGSGTVGGGPADQARREHRDVENVYGLLDTETVELVNAATMHVSEIDPAVAAALRMGRTRGEGLYRRELVRRDGTPTCVIESWVAITLLGGRPGGGQLENTLLSPRPLPQSTTALVAAVVGEQLAREDHVTSAATASAKLAALLELSDTPPVLRVLTTASSPSWPLMCAVRTYAPQARCAFASFPSTN